MSVLDKVIDCCKSVFTEIPIANELLEMMKDITPLYVAERKRQFNRDRHNCDALVIRRGNTLAAKIFFDENKMRVQKIASWLFDDLSRDIYLKMIDVRCTDNYEGFPHPLQYEKYRKPYFWNSFFTYNKNEVYVDCGTYNGDTIANFKKAMRYYKGAYRSIIAFEPDPANYKLVRKNCPDVTAFNSGVWSEDTVLRFNAVGTTGSTLFESSKGHTETNDMIEIPAKALDNCPECSGATFIKMDIEGAELQALIGAESLILKNKPKLAICIYHSNEDMLQIAEWIHEKVPDYKLFIRQHNYLELYETVLYATL